MKKLELLVTYCSKLLKHRPTFRENYLHPALEQGLIEMTIPEKPNSRLQKYRLTPQGEKRLVRESLSSM